MWVDMSDISQAIRDALPVTAKPQDWNVKMHKWKFDRVMVDGRVTVDIVCKNLE
jgi:hypothetical protein